MYLPNDVSKYFAIDIEADSLTPTVIHCMAAVNCRTGEELSFTNIEAIRDWVGKRKGEGCKFIGHNIIGYDAPNLNRLCGTQLTVSDIIDTMVMSMVYSPSLDGGHALGDWGDRLGLPKGDFSDFSTYTEEMMRYCLQDTRICRQIFLRLVRRMQQAGFTDVGIEIEHRSWQLIKKQQHNGFAFNIKEAHVLYAQLREIEGELQNEIYEYWPAQLLSVGVFQRPYKKDGSRSSNYERHLSRYPRVVESGDKGTYECFDYVYFNIGSPAQRIQKLLELGWTPREFTKPSKTHPDGQPKATEKGQLVPSLVEFVEASGKQEVRLIASWIEYNSRANMVNTWIEAYNSDTGCIHGSLWLANTLRYRHSNPNSANIPGVRHAKDKSVLLGKAGIFTYEARNLWGVRDPSRRRLVGVDAKGIQLRVLAHYLNNPEFTDIVINGDPHSYFQALGEFATRDISKTFIYSFFLGAGDAKVGTIIGGTASDGGSIKRRFVNSTPGLKSLLANLKGQVERTGRIKLCDGTPVIVDRPHTVLAYLLQGDESRIMKKAGIDVDRIVRKRRLDVIKVCDVHDEFQFDVLKEHVEEFTHVLPTAFENSGKFFNYNVPIACSVQDGMTWSETH